VSVFSIGALVGALLSGLLSDLAGRKVTLIAGASLYALGGTLQTSSFFLWLVYTLLFLCMWSDH
jgi:MFS family permease